jgi:chromosome segregation ATPase
MRTNEMIFWDEMNWENLLSFAAQFFGLVIVARWLGDTPDEKVVLTVAATILYAAYLLLSIIKAKHNETAAQLEQTQIFYNEQIEETKKASVAYRNVNEQLTDYRRKYDGLLTKLDGVTEQRDVYKELVKSSKIAVDDCREQIKNVTAQRDELLTQNQNHMTTLDELRQRYKNVKQRLDEIKRNNEDVEALRDELKSVKASNSRMVAEVRKYNPDYRK